MKHIYNHLNSESPKVIENSIRAIIDEEKSYLLSFCKLDDPLYADNSNISVEGDFNVIMWFANHMVESIENIEFERIPKMTDNFNFQCFVIHPSPVETVQRTQENT